MSCCPCELSTKFDSVSAAFWCVAVFGMPRHDGLPERVGLICVNLTAFDSCPVFFRN